MNSEEVHWNDKDLQLEERSNPAGFPRSGIWFEGCRPKGLAHRRPRRRQVVLVQLGRPGDHAVDHGDPTRPPARRPGAEATGLKYIICATSTITDDIAPGPQGSPLVPRRWSPTTSRT